MSNRDRGFLNRCARFARRALPAVLPGACVLCGCASDEELFCAACAAELPVLPAAQCRICALPLASGTVCGACLAHPPAYDGTVAPYAYAFPVDALIAACKYAGDLTLVPALASALRAAPPDSADCMVAMPLAPARLKARGFNQAHELARHIGRTWGVPVLTDACRRVHDTAPQAALPWDERARNVRGAFVCDVDVAGRRVAIVDDVMTTGATMNELAKTLKRAGAAAVYACVVARTLRD